MSDLQISHGWKIDRTSAPGIPANVTSNETAPINMTATRPSDLITLAGVTRGRFQFFGQAANNATNTVVALYLVDSNVDPAASPSAADFYTVILLCSVVLTAENRVAAAATQFGNAGAERFADTITVTDGITTALDGSRFASLTAAYNTTDLGAELVVADFGGAHWLKINYTTIADFTGVNTLYNLIE